jgi:D-alanyl-D-alanine carboxypeptidase
VKQLPVLCLAAVFFLAFCGGGKHPDSRIQIPLPPGAAPPGRGEAETSLRAGKPDTVKLERVLAAADIPSGMAQPIITSARQPAPGGAEPSGAFLTDLEKILAGADPFLRILVDKQRPLPAEYEPEDLIELRYGSYRAGIADVMMLRRKAEAALEEMAAAAHKEGITLTVSSAYRSYEYQTGSFERWTRRLGLAEAERISARPGRSQHQLGLVVDFGSITNGFADTPAGRWVLAHGSRFGWSLSYPRGQESLTGYAWESWHYRYVGRELSAFTGAWFGGIQQYALRFIHEWEGDKG